MRFLRHLTGASVDFLIVGGQAKHGFDGRWDLDLWIDWSSSENQERATDAVVAWLIEHPSHCFPGTIERLRQGIGNATMLTVPDADVLYDLKGELASVEPSTGMELMFGSADLLFSEFLGRASLRPIDEDLSVYLLSAEDIARLPRLEKVRGHADGAGQEAST